MNKIILIGRIGKELELKQSKAGKPYLQNSLATNDGFGDKEKTNWHNFSVFGKSAEYLDKYGAKGAMIYLEGSLDHTEYEGKWRSTVLVEKCSVLKDGAAKDSPARTQKSKVQVDEDIPF